MVNIATLCINFFCVYQCCTICYICMAIFITLRGEIHNSIQHKLQNSMEVDSVGFIAILSMSYITTRIVKAQTSVAKIPRVPVENQFTTLSVVKIAIKFSPCALMEKTKTDYPSSEDVKNFYREIFIMKFAGHHQNMVSIIGHCTINVARPKLVVEYCNQGDLQTYLRTVSLK